MEGLQGNHSGFKTYLPISAEDEALLALDQFSERWDNQYPQISRSCRSVSAHESTPINSRSNQSIFFLSSTQEKVMSGKTKSEILARYWQQHIEAWQSSGQTQQAYCKVHELSYHRFGYWSRKCRQPSQERQSEKGSGFVPITQSATSQSTELSLVLPSGLVLHGIEGLHNTARIG